MDKPRQVYFLLVKYKLMCLCMLCCGILCGGDLGIKVLVFFVFVFFVAGNLFQLYTGSLMISSEVAFISNCP